MSMMQNPREVAAAQAAQARGEAEAARQEAAEARAEAAQARAEARDAAREAQQEAREAARAGEPVITIIRDGKPVELGDLSTEQLSQLGVPPERDSRGSEAYGVGVAGILATAVVLIVGMRTWFRAKVLRTAPAALSPDMEARMMRIEAAVESVAVEVERISEGQRFTTRLLNDRAKNEVARG